MDQLIISLAYKFNGWGLTLYVLVTTLLAGVLSGIIGIEREIKGQAAGLRTHVLVSVGCVLIMVVSIFGIGLASGQIDLSKGYIDPNLIKYDTARIAAGITAGIGFVSAGTIIRNGFSVRGLTTAATLWVCSGIGMACGCGLILEAMVTAAVTMGLLMGLLFIERAIGKRSPQIKITVQKGVAIIRDLRLQADANGLIIKNIGTSTAVLETGEEVTVVRVLFALQSSQAVLEEFCESFETRQGVLPLNRIHFKNPLGE